MGLIDCFRLLYPDSIKYTYFSARGNDCRASNQGWRIDHYLVNKQMEKNIIDCVILNDYYGSDHCPITLKVLLSKKL